MSKIQEQTKNRLSHKMKSKNVKWRHQVKPKIHFEDKKLKFKN